MDTALRNALWNWTRWALDKEVSTRISGAFEYWHNAAVDGLWDELFHLPTDEVPSPHLVPDVVKKRFMAADWYEVYNFIEYLLPRVNEFRGTYDCRKGIADRLNRFLAREMAGYRAIDNRLVPVTSPVELSAIDEARTPRPGFEGVAQHIDAALALLAQKPEPDCRNSVKESISAVEAVVKLLTGEKSGGVDRAVAILESRGAVHPAFKAALSKLYGYTSDKEGIRHPILDEATVSFAEAKFMLVACSAFVNLLVDDSD